jgi:hypothetical protein
VLGFVWLGALGIQFQGFWLVWRLKLDWHWLLGSSLW